MRKTSTAGRLFRIIFTLAVIPAVLSGLALAEENGRHPLFSLDFSGSSNHPGKVFKVDPSAGYRFSNHFEVDAGLPIYIVRPSATGIADGFSAKNGIGNAYLDLRFFVSRPDLYFSSNIRGTAPTGSSTDGFSTGRATFDWSNYLQKDFGKFTPFGSAGVANTISDTHFFTRPFTSLGIVGHLEGGAYFALLRHLSIAGSVYAITPSGEQKVYSKLMKQAAATSSSGGTTMPSKGNSGNRAFETAGVTTGQATLARDHGYSGWIDIRPSKQITLEVGYSRSISYALDTIFFSAGFDIGSLFSRMNR